MENLPAVAPAYRKLLLAAAVRRYEEAAAMDEYFDALPEDPGDDRPARCAHAAGVIRTDAELALLKAIMTGDGPD